MNGFLHPTGRGRRHPLVAILAMAAAAVLTGARSMTAIAEWATDKLHERVSAPYGSLWPPVWLM
jgi:hypothetical protein